MSISAIVFIIIAVVVLFGAIHGIRGQRSWNKKYPEEIARAGFTPSQDAREHVTNEITRLFHQKANIINEVKEIRRLRLNNDEVYFCDVNLGGKGRYDLILTDLFIFPFKIGTDRPLLVFLKSDSADGSAYTKDIITKKYVLSDLYKPDGLVKLDLPDRPGLDPILYVYGESTGSLDGVFDSTLWHHILRAGEHGFFIFYYGKETAALLTLERYKNHAIYKIEWTRQWQYVQDLMRASR